MKILLAFILLLGSHLITFGQTYSHPEKEKSFVLVKLTDSTKRKLLKPGTEELIVRYETCDSLNTYRQVSMDGTLEDLSAYTLNFSLYNEDTRYFKDYYPDYEMFINYPYDSSVIREFDLQDVKAFSYRSSNAEIFNNISKFLMIGGFATALVVAPVLSINYHSWEFNENRYFPIAGYGLVAFGVSVPLMILTREKTYNLNTTCDCKQNKLWYLQKVAQ